MLAGTGTAWKDAREGEGQATDPDHDKEPRLSRPAYAKDYSWHLSDRNDQLQRQSEQRGCSSSVLPLAQPCLRLPLFSQTAGQDHQAQSIQILGQRKPAELSSIKLAQSTPAGTPQTEPIPAAPVLKCIELGAAPNRSRDVNAEEPYGIQKCQLPPNSRLRRFGPSRVQVSRKPETQPAVDVRTPVLLESQPSRIRPRHNVDEAQKAEEMGQAFAGHLHAAASMLSTAKKSPSKSPEYKKKRSPASDQIDCTRLADDFDQEWSLIDHPVQNAPKHGNGHARKSLWRSQSDGLQHTQHQQKSVSDLAAEVWKADDHGYCADSEIDSGQCSAYSPEKFEQIPSPEPLQIDRDQLDGGKSEGSALQYSEEGSLPEYDEASLQLTPSTKPGARNPQTQSDANNAGRDVAKAVPNHPKPLRIEGQNGDSGRSADPAIQISEEGSLPDLDGVSWPFRSPSLLKHEAKPGRQNTLATSDAKTAERSAEPLYLDRLEELTQMEMQHISSEDDSDLEELELPGRAADEQTHTAAADLSSDDGAAVPEDFCEQDPSFGFQNCDRAANELRLAEYDGVGINWEECSKGPVHVDDAVATADLVRWMVDAKLEEHIPAFLQAGLTLSDISWLGDSELVQMGVECSAERLRVLNIIHKNLKLLPAGKACEPDEDIAAKPLQGDSMQNIRQGCENGQNSIPKTGTLADYFSAPDSQKGGAITDFFRPVCGQKHRKENQGAAVKPSRIQNQAKENRPVVPIGGSGETVRVPNWHRVPGTSFLVDKFGRKVENSVTCRSWFLSHFHADHYMGLNGRFRSGLIYCTRITATLCNTRLNVHMSRLRVVELNQPIEVEGVKVTFVNANHCPGAAMIIFEVPGKRAALHCGDCRCGPTMEQDLCLQRLKDQQINLFLDTTYCSPEYDFPPQAEVLQYVVDILRAEKYNLGQTLFVFGSYTIGKERLFLEAAKILQQKVYVCKAKRKVLDALNLPPEYQRLLTTDDKAATIHAVTMNMVNAKQLAETAKYYKKRFTTIVAIRPTGWTHKQERTKASRGQRVKKGSIIMYSVPYSEHSSFTELRRFVQWLNPKAIIPTVGCKPLSNIGKMVEMLRAP